MSSAAAWMPLYVGDYLGDTQRLTTEQHGAYLLLMLDYWRNGPPPDDDGVLQQITKLDRAAWRKHRPILSGMFQIADGAWNHKRIDREMTDARDNAKRRSEKAKAGAKARWGQCSDDAPSMPGALPVECAPPSPSSVTFTDVKDNSAAIDEDKRFWDDAKAYLGKSKASLIGQWVRDHGKTDTASAIAAAQVERAVNPVEFIQGRFRKLATNGYGPGHSGIPL